MKKFMSPPEDYVDVGKSLNAMIREISSGSEDEVSYIKTTPSHPRDETIRLRQKLNKEDKKKRKKGKLLLLVITMVKTMTLIS